MCRNASLILLVLTGLGLLPLTQVESNSENASEDRLVGIWQYSLYSDSPPAHYLRVLKVGPGKYRLIEGFKGGYVKDKNKIMWQDRKEGNYTDDVIYLRPSHGKLKGEIVSGVFRATHGTPFTYKLTLSLKSNDKLEYSIWSSIRGETETFEATRVVGSAPIASPISRKQLIPAQFQGAWDAMDGKVNRCKYGADSASRVTVTSSKVLYYEARCNLVKAGSSNRNTFNGTFDCEGEGERWKQDISLTLNDGKLLHKGLGSGISRNHRCK